MIRNRLTILLQFVPTSEEDLESQLQDIISGKNDVFETATSSNDSNAMSEAIQNICAQVTTLIETYVNQGTSMR